MTHFRIWQLCKLGRTWFSKSGHRARTPQFTHAGPPWPQAPGSVHMKHLPRKPNTAGSSPHWAVRRWASEDLWSLPQASPFFSSFHVMKIYFPSKINSETRELWESCFEANAFPELCIWNPWLSFTVSIKFLPWHSLSPTVHAVTIIWIPASLNNFVIWSFPMTHLINFKNIFHFFLVIKAMPIHCRRLCKYFKSRKKKIKFTHYPITHWWPLACFILTRPHLFEADWPDFLKVLRPAIPSHLCPFFSSFGTSPHHFPLCLLFITK